MSEYSPLLLRLAAKAPAGVTLTPPGEGAGTDDGGYDLETGAIHLTSPSANILAHELGHHRFGQGWGRVLQNKALYPLIDKAPFLGVAGGAGSGLLRAAGFRDARVHTALLALPLLATAPALITEAFASRNGRDVLRESGASPEEVRQYTEELAQAYATYAGKPLLTGATTAMGYGIGRYAGPAIARGLSKLAYDADTDVKQRFEHLKELMRQHGALAGTAHRRIVIPKDKLTEKDIKEGLGFTPVSIAIPEAGQDRFESFRHHEHNYHIHSHPEGWTMHEDKHPAATMLAKNVDDPVGKMKAMIAGVPHVIHEGVPGLYYYIKGRLARQGSTARRVLNEMPSEIKDKIYSLPHSPTWRPTREEELLGKAAALAEFGLVKESDIVASFRTAKDRRKKWKVDQSGDKYTCTCPDYTYRKAATGGHCKHIAQHAGGHDTSGEKKANTVDEEGVDAPALVAAGVGAAAPWAGTIGQEKLIHAGKGPAISDYESLLKKLRPGDVVLTGDPSLTRTKAIIGAATGHPTGYHVGVVDRTGKLVYESHPAFGFDKNTLNNDYLAKERVQVLRPNLRGPQREEFLRNMEEYQKLTHTYSQRTRQNLRRRGLNVTKEYDDLLRGGTYDNKGGIVAGLKELFVPKLKSTGAAEAEKVKIRGARQEFRANMKQHAATNADLYETLAARATRTGKNLGGEDFQAAVPKCVGGVCSTVPASSMPKGKNVVKGKGPRDVMPTDYLRSKMFRPVGTYNPAPTAALHEKLLRYGPVATRIGAGLALGGAAYGAVKGVQHLMRGSGSGDSKPTT